MNLYHQKRKWFYVVLHRVTIIHRPQCDMFSHQIIRH